MSTRIVCYLSSECSICGCKDKCAVHSGTNPQKREKAFCGECWRDRIGIVTCGMCGSEIGCGNVATIVCVQCVNDLIAAKECSKESDSNCD